MMETVKKVQKSCTGESQSISRRDLREHTPTHTSAQHVAASGMISTKGRTKRSERRKAEPVTKDAKPVRAPLSMPVRDSM